MKPSREMKPRKEQIQQLRTDLNNLSEADFNAKYSVSMSELKGLSDTELEERASKSDIFWWGPNIGGGPA
mgnify:CR=1 FL=1